MHDNESMDLVVKANSTTYIQNESQFLVGNVKPQFCDEWITSITAPVDLYGISLLLGTPKVFGHKTKKVTFTSGYGFKHLFQHY